MKRQRVFGPFPLTGTIESLLSEAPERCTALHLRELIIIDQSEGKGSPSLFHKEPSKVQKIHFHCIFSVEAKTKC